MRLRSPTLTVSVILAFTLGTARIAHAAGEAASSVTGIDFPEDERIDLWVSGPVTLIHTDGVLWYVAVCPAPGASVLCVTYSGNGLKTGDLATVRGGMKVPAAGHAMLEPCLVSPDRRASTGFSRPRGSRRLRCGTCWILQLSR